MKALTKKELAELLRVHPNTIDRWRKKGMPCMKSGAVIRFSFGKVADWLETTNEEFENVR